jgi:hypothetical protein
LQITKKFPALPAGGQILKNSTKQLKQQFWDHIFKSNCLPTHGYSGLLTWANLKKQPLTH